VRRVADDKKKEEESVVKTKYVGQPNNNELLQSWTNATVSAFTMLCFTMWCFLLCRVS